MGTSQNPNQESEMDPPAIDRLCERTVAMNLLQCCHTNSVDEMNCEEWGKGTEKPQVIPACQGCIELRKEVSDLRNAVNMILPMLPMYPSISNVAAGLVAAQPTFQNILTQSVLRKRPTAQTSSVPQPECPVSMRTVLNNPGLQNLFLNQWMLAPTLKPPSPTLPTGSLPAAAVGEQQQLASTDEQPVKWSSPSSVESNGQKTDSSAASAGETQNIDIIGDGSESPTSSTHSQQEIAASVLMNAQVLNALKETYLFPQVAAPQAEIIRIPPPQPVQTNGINGTNGMKPAAGGPERKPRKPVNDDIVKIVRNQDLSDKNIATFEIPVPKALESDPSFRPVSEQQIIQQIIQGKKYEEMEVGECMIQLCKKLAEKRVFGPRLMSQTTVAGLNHSNYSNLPIKGICYIQHVCRKVLLDKFENEEDFWDKFREAMRKLAARCRRVRHAKKTKHNREEAQAEMLSKRYGEDIPFGLAAHNGLLRPKVEVPEPAPANDLTTISIGHLSQFLNQQLNSERKLNTETTPVNPEVLANIINLLSSQIRKNEPTSPSPQ